MWKRTTQYLLFFMVTFYWCILAVHVYCRGHTFVYLLLNSNNVLELFSHLYYLYYLFKLHALSSFGSICPSLYLFSVVSVAETIEEITIDWKWLEKDLLPTLCESIDTQNMMLYEPSPNKHHLLLRLTSYTVFHFHLASFHCVIMLYW